MSSIVISQPMYFPWLGIFNQMEFCDNFIHYDDVSLSRGFINRIQVKTDNGINFITVPIKSKSQNILIKDAFIDYDSSDWIHVHRNKLINSIKGAKHKDLALEIFDRVISKNHVLLSDLNIDCIQEVSKISPRLKHVNFHRSSSILKTNSSSERLLDICKEFGASSYITGHGAINYLKHNLFEAENIEVKYIQYGFNKYNQNFGNFTPFVTCLDSIAHTGPYFADAFNSSLLNWKYFITLQITNKEKK